MAYSSATTTASGSSANVAVPFGYLDIAHVNVTLNGVLVDQDTLEWTSPQQITLPSTPAVGVSIKVYRTTPITSLETIFQVPLVLNDRDLNKVLKQLLYITQEAYDVGNEAGILVGGSIDYISEAVSIVAGYVETVSGDAAAAEAAKTAAEEARDIAAAWGEFAGNPVTIVTATGLATKSGSNPNVVIDVPAADGEDVTDGTRDDVAVTPQALAEAGVNAPYVLPLASAAEITAGTVTDKAVAPDQLKAAGIVADSTPPGTVRFRYMTEAWPGWVLLNDGSFGDTGSGATYAGPEYEAVYTALYNSTDNVECPVSGGRGANAAADWAAGKTIAQPTVMSRLVGVAGGGAGLTERLAGEIVGEETHQLTSGEQASMSVTGSFSGQTASDVVTGGEGPQSGILVDVRASNIGKASVSGTISGTASGGGGAHNNLPPSTFIPAEIKL